jgi:GNAT superfamily N-acetyltransferase
VTEQFRSERLDAENHDLSTFTCGEKSLDRWLHEQAIAATKRGTARTWVWTDDDGAVVAYYALAAHKIVRDQVPAGIGRSGPAEIPAVLIARLALARHLRGQGLGSVLVADALERVVEASRIVDARLVVVDAIAEPVAGLYETLGFRRVPNSLMLVQRISDISASYEL